MTDQDHHDQQSLAAGRALTLKYQRHFDAAQFPQEFWADFAAALRMREGVEYWREGWAWTYSGASNLYIDDGELQDNRTRPFIDWRRDSAEVIREKIIERGLRAIEAKPEAVTEAMIEAADDLDAGIDARIVAAHLRARAGRLAAHPAAVVDEAMVERALSAFNESRNRGGNVVGIAMRDALTAAIQEKQ